MPSPLEKGALFLLILTVGCVSLEALKALTVGAPVFTLVEVLSVKADVIPGEVESGKGTSVFFTASNDGNTTLKNVNVDITDPCALKFDKDSHSIKELLPGEFEDWQWEAKAGTVELSRDCGVRYTLSYDSESLAFYDISAISEAEYTRLLKEGELEKRIKLKYSKTKSPVDIALEVSKPQPIISGSEFFLYLQMIDTGGGEAEVTGLKLKYPEFLKLVSCDDLSGSGELSLKGSLEFLNRKTKRMTCKFSADNDVLIAEVGPFEVSATYKYTQTNILNVRVVPK